MNHTYLITTGQTTWEYFRARTISFRKCYKPGYEPFNYGI